MTFDEQAALMNRKSVAELLAAQQQLIARNAELKRQIEWFTKQLFGSRSERRFVDPDGRQLSLGEWRQPDKPGKEITVAEHHRRSRRTARAPHSDGDLRFDESVPVKEIRLPAPEIDAEHEVISEKVTHRLAQRPASYVLLRYIRPVVKRKVKRRLGAAPRNASVPAPGDRGLLNSKETEWR